MSTANGQVELADAGLLATYVVHPSDAAVASLRIGQRGGYSLDPVTEVVWASILGTEKKRSYGGADSRRGAGAPIGRPAH